MNRIDQLFKTKANRIKSVFFTAGYPQLESTIDIGIQLEKQGIDMLEIGMPFSDPIADGPVIQHSSNIALKNGMHLNLLLSQVKVLRQSISIPILLMGYINPIYKYGLELFLKESSESGVDGMIIPDLPFDLYVDQYKPIFDSYGIKYIPLITNTSTAERINKIDSLFHGFIYAVSSAGTTGAKNSFDKETVAYFKRLKAMHLQNPVLIGFGVSNTTTCNQVFNHLNGVIIGSAFIKCLQESKDISSGINRFIHQINEEL